MAVTQDPYTGDGTTTDYNFTFPYLKQSEVKASLDGTATPNFRFLTATRIQFVNNTTANTPTAPASGVKIKIFRETETGSLAATFYAGSSIKSQDLNENFTQNLYAAQEVTERYLSNLGGTMAGDLNLGEDVIIKFEGATDNAHETILTVTDPTADRTITLPNVSGTVPVLAVTSNTAITSTPEELNILDGVTATKDELNILDGVTSTKDELNILDGVTADKDDLNILDGVTATTAELNYVDGVTSNVQTQLDAKQPLDAELTELATMGSTTAGALADLTQAEVQILDGATVTTAELNILDGVTADKDELNKTDGLLATTTELNTLDGIGANTSELNKLQGYTGSTTNLNIVAGKTFKTSSGTLDTTSDTEIPSSKVIASHVASSQSAIGGFVTIADEVSFPNTQPLAGVVVSINNAAGVVVNGSGVSTSAKRADNTTVTINGFPSSLNSETLAAGVGLVVTSTSTANTYAYHKILTSETDVKQLSDDINDFNSRYRIASSAPSSNNDAGDMYFDTSANKMKVYNGTTSAWDDVASVGSFYVNTISSSSGNGGGSATFNGSAYRFTLSNAGTSAQQHIVSVNGVIQKPNSGTSQPSEGFALSGNDIIFSAAPASGSDSFIITCGSSVSIGTPSANSVNSSHIIDGSIVNGDISSTANIAGSKLADNSITSNQMATGSVGQGHLQGEAVNESKIQISNTGTNGQFLQKQSGNNGGLTWAAANTPVLTTQGDLLYRDGSGEQRLAKGTAGQQLTMNAGATAPEWSAPPAGTSIAAILKYTNL
jgi:hypothetical protein